MSHSDFTYDPTPLEATTPPERSEAHKPRKASEVARAAATLAWKIRNTEADAAKWKPLIEAADPELQECLREFLKQVWREMQERKRRDQVGKRCESGDRVISELAKRYGTIADSAAKD